MSTGRNYNSHGDTILRSDMGDLEHKIVQALFESYFESLNAMNDPRRDHETNSAIYATCRTVFANAGITDQALDIFELIFPGLEAVQ